ncbi:MAG: 3'-5' exoribonuclease YhaM family protein, partial [Bradymonadaceae bacterium]
LSFKALVHSMDSRLTRAGKPFVDLVLQDKTGKISAKLWDTATGPAAGQVIYARGKVSEYQGQAQVVLGWHTVEEDADVSEYVTGSHRPPQELLDEVERLLYYNCEGPVWDVLSYIISNHKDALLTSPAAKGNHHARHGGLIEHIHSMMHLAIFHCEHYHDRYGEVVLDVGLVLAGVFLHDIGKVVELSGHIGTEYTTTGKLVGHIPHGLLMLERAIQAHVDDTKNVGENHLTEEMADQLRHLILSHHGKMEWGSPIVPQTPEAVLLHQLDMMDSRMDPVCIAVQQAPPTGGWVQGSRAVGSLYVTSDGAPAESANASAEPSSAPALPFDCNP